MGEQNKWYNVWVLGIRRRFCPRESGLKWSGGEGVRRSRNREPRAWGGLTTEATAAWGAIGSACKGSGEEGGEHGLRSGLNLRERRGNGKEVGLGE